MEMNLELDKLINILDNDSRIIRLEELKKIITSDKEFMNDFNELKELDVYSNEYKELKKKLFSNEYFKEFKELEQEINYLILEINNRLKELTNERRCINENN